MAVQALLISNGSESIRALKDDLKQLPVATRQAGSCEEATHLIGPQVDVIFTDLTLRDGNWIDVVDLARRAHSAAEVVVVSRLPDTKLYVEVMERGGFDFITPPLGAHSLQRLLDSATAEPAKRWGAPLRAGAA
ncbi:MAG: response regulator [Terriglobia bacterium]